MTQANVSRNAQSSFITKAEIKSNKDKKKIVSLLGGMDAPGPRLSRLMYFESILQDTVKAEIIFDDTGGAIDNKSTIEGLRLVSTEEVKIEFEDNNQNKMKVTLYVNKVSPMYEDTKKSRVMINMVSEEFLFNEDIKARLNKRYDGKISEHIKKILTDNLKSKKKKDIEETSNNYNFIGNNRKPYYSLNWLSKAAVPSKNGKKGESAGFFFFETSEGFKFKSIDGLFAQEVKKKLIFNDSGDKDGQVPAGYDGKVLEQQSDNGVNAQDNFQMGAYGTRLVLFNPFTCEYRVIKATANESQKGTKLAGKELPVLNEKFRNSCTRTTYRLLDVGTLPTGDVKEQIKKSKDQNHETQHVLNQAIRRYGQMFAGMQTITIAGDFSLHAGDKVQVDIPGLRPDKKDELNKEYSGEYIIADLCHYVTAKETYTKLNLVRDSFGRKIQPRKNIPL